MARSWRWFAGVHVLLSLGSMMEEHMLSSHDFFNAVGGLSVTLWTASAVAHGLGGLVVGVIFDRLGPKASMLVANVSYLAFESSVWLGLIQLSRVLRILAHPAMIPWALATRECTAEARIGFLGRAYLNQMAVLVFFGIVHIPLVVSVGKVFFFSLPLLSLALSAVRPSAVIWGRQLTGVLLQPASALIGAGVPPLPPSAGLGLGLIHRGGSQLRGKSRRGVGRVAVSAHCGRVASTGRQGFLLHAGQRLEDPPRFPFQTARRWLSRILSRPNVLMAFALVLTMNYLRDTLTAAMSIAFSDPSEPYFNGETYGLTQGIIMLLCFLSWTFLPTMYMRKFGPTLVMQVLLAIAAAVFVLDAVLCLLPAAMTLGQGLLLNLSMMPLTLARDGADFAAGIFLVGVVDPGERGTLWGLKSTCGNRGVIPLPLHFLVGRLYHLGGLPVVFVLNSGICFAMLLLFRKSALMNIRLKEA